MKRIISFFMIFSMILGGASIANAENTEKAGQRESDILKGIGIYDTAEISSGIRRADFAGIVTRIMGGSENEISEPAKRVFIDVPLESSDSGVINYLYE